jgi:tetratricopeptide (TPR) repeat protein
MVCGRSKRPLARLARMSPRSRTRLLVGVAAVVSAVLVVGVTVLQVEDGEGAGEAGAERAPPLELGIVVRDDALARSLRAAEELYDAGRREAARRRFEELLAEHPNSTEAAVGAAIASWPEGTLRRLQGLVAERPSSGVARLHLGLALLADGREAAAADEWRQVGARDADSPAALRAEDLLHPEAAPGRPPFVWPLARQPGLAGLSPARQLAELERRAQAGGAGDWLRYGIALQRVGRPVSARRAFARAVELAPDDLDAQVAAAVGRFDKDDPSQMFSRLGPLSQRNPRAAVVRYHLGLGLTWIGAVEEARRQLRLAAEAEPQGFYGREAERLLSRIEGAGS